MGVGLDQPSHWVIIAVLAMLLFGYKKMPDMARSAGKSLRIFKTEMKGMADDDDVRAATQTKATGSTVAPVAVPPPAIAPVAEAGFTTAPRDVPAANLDPSAPPATN